MPLIETITVNGEDLDVILDDTREKRPTFGGHDLASWCWAQKQADPKAEPVHAVATATGLTRQAVTNWIMGWCSPRKNARRIIHAVTGIKPSRWDRFLPRDQVPPDGRTRRIKKVREMKPKKLTGFAKVTVTNPDAAIAESLYGYGGRRVRTTWLAEFLSWAP